MAINSVSGAVAGQLAPVFFQKATNFGSSVVPCSSMYLGSIPAAGSAPTPGIAGVALTSYAGQLGWTNPSGASLSYVSRLDCVGHSTPINLYLVDRLWHNSGIDVTSTGAQTINSATWPARDRNGSTNGDGVMIGVEVSTNMGAGTPTFTMVYTNSAGTGSQSITTSAMATTMQKSSFIPIPLVAGDIGVRSIQTWTQSATMTSGVYHLVAYRILAQVESIYYNPVSIDALSGGFTRCYDNTVPFLISYSGATYHVYSGSYNVSQG